MTERKATAQLFSECGIDDEIGINSSSNVESWDSCTHKKQGRKPMGREGWYNSTG